ncbi:MAG: hypothetical protein UV01_C0001G0064 [Parcubacteria group bacterium GW2011_GWA2_42_14]|nr:MAG: hypothetical protein UV01_C0001G0064 [Parcubacteria group bacterium GW2011_GWA2_42_14]
MRKWNAAGLFLMSAGLFFTYFKIWPNLEFVQVIPSILVVVWGWMIYGFDRMVDTKRMPFVLTFWAIYWAVVAVIFGVVALWWGIAMEEFFMFGYLGLALFFVVLALVNFVITFFELSAQEKAESK